MHKKIDGIFTLRGDYLGFIDFTCTSTRWNLNDKDIDAINAHYCVSVTYDYYHFKFNRRSLDGHGMVIYTYVNDPNQNNNSIWDGTSLRLGKSSKTGKTLCTLDIVGHELTHGVIENTCRLHKDGESGAICESICDIMGKAIEYWKRPETFTWDIGHEIGLNARDMSNPTRYNQPSFYLDSEYWYKGDNQEIYDHTNSGVGNYMFYLLVTGDAIKNSFDHQHKVKGIGVEKAAQIIYRSMVEYLSAKSNYSDWKSACIKSADDIFGKNSFERNAVISAWNEVKVN